MAKKKKISARRKQVRENIASQRYSNISEFLNSGIPISILLLIGFAICSIAILSFGSRQAGLFRPWVEITSISGIILMVSMGIGSYVIHAEPNIVKKHTRAISLVGLFLLLLIASKLGGFFDEWIYLSVGTSVTCAIILTVAYNQRFALGMSIFYSVIACFTVGSVPSIEVFLAMLAGVVMCCFSLKEIRTRMKLLEVGILAAVAVFVMSLAMGFVFRADQLADIEAGLGIGVPKSISIVFGNAGKAAGITFIVGLFIQALLPVIEKVFKIATSMTLLDFSDANQPLLKRLAMEAPGTYSHCLLIGSITEAAAQSIGANGLLCRVGSYYHDIGKINKPRYFIENQMGINSHDQLSPAMSQLVIVGHVKDGIEMAKEYGLPAVLRQFIETHHGTTLIEYFYNQAKLRQQDDKGVAPSEAEFRYPGPKPQTKEAAIVMLSDAVEGAIRSLSGDVTPTRIEVVVRNMALKRLQDGQFDECDLTLKELSKIEASLTKSLAAHYHGRIAYPKSPEEPVSQGQ